MESFFCQTYSFYLFAEDLFYCNIHCQVQLRFALWQPGMQPVNSGILMINGYLSVS